jgi:hypothetical protein
MVVKARKKNLTWGGSPLCKNANFLPHQSHAKYELPRSHKPFWFLLSHQISLSTLGS